MIVSLLLSQAVRRYGCAVLVAAGLTMAGSAVIQLKVPGPTTT